MTESTKDAGMIQVLVEQLEKQELPRVLSIKDKVDAGEVLDKFDIEFLDQMLKDTNTIKPLLDRHPEWQPLAARMISLYKEVTGKALENQNADDKSF